MATQHHYTLSVVVPIYDEASGLADFHADLVHYAKEASQNSYEIIYCDDGSNDNTDKLVYEWHKNDPNIKLIKLSRNFGKENALAAGIAFATGQAIITLDGDGQHPAELIPDFVRKWRTGAQVVIGVRISNKGEGWFKRVGSKLFHKLFNVLTGQKLLSGSSDFRLIDRSVQQAFLQLGETDRITRGLIDWLGFNRELIEFTAKARQSGAPGYNRRKLVKLATNSFVSLTPTPLYLFGYLGVFITIGSLFLGAAVFIEQLLLNDPWHWKFTGTAMLGILILFLVGIILISQGILSLYISHIQNQSKGRPLYVIDHKASLGIEKINNDA